MFIRTALLARSDAILTSGTITPSRLAEGPGSLPGEDDHTFRVRVQLGAVDQEDLPRSSPLVTAAPPFLAGLAVRAPPCLDSSG